MLRDERTNDMSAQDLGAANVHSDVATVRGDGGGERPSSRSLLGRHGSLDIAESVEPITDTSRSGQVIWRGVLAYPGLLITLFFLLIIGRVSGSSIAILSDHARDPGLLSGSPQWIRSDEWTIHTPNFIGQMNSGAHSERLIGVGVHDLSVLGDLPTREWSLIFRPDNLASMFLPAENALAWNWWLPMLIAALAFYGMAWLCGLGLGLSISISMLISFSPFVEWWHSSAITGSLGFGSAACFSILVALRSRSRMAAIFWSVSTVYWVVAFVFVLYPPFQIATILGLIPITFAMIAADVAGRRYTFARAAASMGVVALSAGVVVVAFVLEHQDAISAIRGTVYPGARQSTGGGGSLPQLFSADFSPLLAYGPPVFGGTNLSEIAAPYLFATESLVVLLLAGWRRTDVTSRNVAFAAACSLSLGLAWHQLPLPDWVGSFFLLNFVPPQRVLPLIGISGPFLLAVLVHSQIPRLGTRRKLVVGMGVASTTFGLAMIEASKIQNLLPSFPFVALLVGAVLGTVAVAALVAAPRMWGTAAIATLVGVGFFSVNPLYRGAGPLEQTEMAQAIRRAGIEATWVNYGDPRAEAFLTASGASTLSGANYYPNSDSWKLLLGGMRDQLVWNRYLETQWLPGSNRAELRLVSDHFAEVRLSPCAPQLTIFGVTRVIARSSTFSVNDTCLHPIESVFWHGSRYVIYARSM